MTRVNDVTDEEAPTVLLVDNNQMALHRLTTIFRQKEMKVEICEDGDRAVDEYIRLDPELVVMSLDIPSLDGHLAALEMREAGGEQRILFTAPKRQAALAQDATHSAGAIGWIEKPVTASAVESIWQLVLGKVPEAPGMRDLDEIHPAGEMIEVEPDIEDIEIPSLPINPLPAEERKPTKKRSSKGKRLMIVLVLFSAIGAAGWYAWENGLIQV